MLKDNLKQFRRNNNMSQEELASKVCVSRSSIALYEKGIRKPSIETIKLICAALHIKIEDLTNDRHIKKSIMNFLFCVFGLFLSLFIFIVLFYEFILEKFFMDKLIFFIFTNKTTYHLTYIFTSLLCILMYYLLHTNFKNRLKKIVISIVTIPASILNIIFSFTPSNSVNISSNFINIILIASLILLYFFINYFIVKNLIFESTYLNEKLNNQTINIFFIVINILFICIVLTSIIYIYTKNIHVKEYTTIYYEYDNSYSYTKTAIKKSLLEVIYTEKLFSLIFLLFQIAISTISLISLANIKYRKNRLLTIINLFFIVIFIIMWTMYPRIFSESVNKIIFVPA